MKIQIIQTNIDMLKKEHTQAVMERNHQKARQIMKKIDKETMELNKARGEELIQKAIDNGCIERLNRLISAAQLLNAVTNNFIQEAADLLTDNGLLVDGIVNENRLFIKAADRYFKEFSKLVDTRERANNMFKDLDYFENWFRMWAKLKERPKEQKLRGCLQAARKANSKSTMCRNCQMRYNSDSIMCKACNKAFIEGFSKGAKWLDDKTKIKK